MEISPGLRAIRNKKQAAHVPCVGHTSGKTNTWITAVITSSKRGNVRGEHRVQDRQLEFILKQQHGTFIYVENIPVAARTLLADFVSFRFS